VTNTYKTQSTYTKQIQVNTKALPKVKDETKRVNQGDFLPQGTDLQGICEPGDKCSSFWN